MMNHDTTISLSPLRFYSQNDESALFEWIDKIKSIKKKQGVGHALQLTLSSSDIFDDDLHDLIALCERYHFDMKQLAVFMNDSNRSWFYENKKAFWHKKVFSDKA